MKNKKGVSGIITTIILIVIALAAIGIAWMIIRGIVDAGGEDIDEKKGDLFDALKTCDQNEGDTCEEDETCSGTEIEAADGLCCPKGSQCEPNSP